MSIFPTPSFVKRQYDFSIAWFDKSNSFVVVDGIIEEFVWELASNSIDDVSIKLICKKNAAIDSLIKKISSNNISAATNLLDAEKYQINPNCFTIITLNGNSSIKISFGTESIKTAFGAPYFHLAVNRHKSILTNLSIKSSKKRLALFQNEKQIRTDLKTEYHYLQAEFSNKIIELYHKIEKPQWLASIHACALTKNDKAILLLGDSGKGKSTLTALLALSGYRFIADDLVLMDHNAVIYDNPAAISLKEDSWHNVGKAYKPLKDMGISTKRKGGTRMKFLPIHPLQKNKPSSFKVTDLIWVNYDNGTTSSVRKLSIKMAFSKIIPDSWIKPNKNSVSVFTNWMESCDFWELDYSDFESCKKVLDENI